MENINSYGALSFSDKSDVDLFINDNVIFSFKINYNDESFSSVVFSCKDGYGNFRNITNRDINSIIDDMVTGLNKSKEDYDL